MTGATNKQYGGLLARVYRAYIREKVKKEIHRQRLKLVYDGWSYYPLLRFKRLSWAERVKLVRKLIRIDWFVLHANKPVELVPVMMDLMSRPGKPNEAFVEAGCWNGGSAAKFSLICKHCGYKLHIFDSFQGVKEWGFAYAAQLGEVQNNLAKYGELDVCTFHPGWFSDTLWQRPVSFPVRMVYIDCDVSRGTVEVLSGVLPALVEDGAIYTQDYHLDDVRRVIHDPKTWDDFGVTAPAITPLVRNIARVTWNREVESQTSS